MKRIAMILILVLPGCSSGSSGSSSSSGGGGGTPPPPPTGGYEGYGAVTQGAESSPTGFTNYVVTSLADNGPGTLRDAVSQPGRNITFAVGGTITLQSTLQIRFSYLTIDGSSAPSPGITIQLPGTVGFHIEAGNSTGPCHDIIIHHLRIDGQATSSLGDGDILGLDGQANPVYNIILDHITARAATDGIFDIWGDVHDVTISWSLIQDTMNAMHISESSGDPHTRQRISFHHNVFNGNNERQLRVRHNSLMIDYVNNVVHGWGAFEGGAYGLRVVHDAGEVNPSLNVEDNVFHEIAGNFGGPNDALHIDAGANRNTVYFNGNIVPAGETDAVSNGPRLPIPASAEVTHYPASTLDDNVVPFVGTQFPTAAEQALLNTIRNNIP